MVSTTLPAVVRVVDLPTGTTITGSELIEAVQTSAGVGQSVQLSLTNIFGSIGGIPSGGATGTILNKSSGSNFSTQFSAINTFVNVGTSLATTGSATSIVAFVANQGISSTQIANNAVGTNQVASSLGIASSLSIGTLLTVAGTATITGTTILNGGLQITGTSLVTGALGVTGTSLFTSGTFGVVGTSLFTSTFGVVGTTLFTSGTFGVVGTSLFTSGAFGIVGTSLFTGQLGVVGTSIHTGSFVLGNSTTGLMWSSGTGLLSATTNIATGLVVTVFNVGNATTGTITPSPLNGNYQYLTNNGAFTVAAYTTFDFALDLLVQNGTAPGALGFSGWRVGTIGNAFSTTARLIQSAIIATGSPGIVTSTAHVANVSDPVWFSTSGSLPTGMSSGTLYYISTATANTFQIATTPGTTTSINLSGAQSGTHTATLPSQYILSLRSIHFVPTYLIKALQ